MWPYEVMISNIARYAEGCLVPLTLDLPIGEFKHASYVNWAIDYILETVLDTPFGDPVDIIEEQLIKFYYFLNLAPDESSRFIFQTAIDTAQDLLAFCIDDC